MNSEILKFEIVNEISKYFEEVLDDFKFKI